MQAPVDGRIETRQLCNDRLTRRGQRWRHAVSLSFSARARAAATAQDTYGPREVIEASLRRVWRRTARQHSPFRSVRASEHMLPRSAIVSPCTTSTRSPPRRAICVLARAFWEGAGRRVGDDVAKNGCDPRAAFCVTRWSAWKRLRASSSLYRGDSVCRACIVAQKKRLDEIFPTVYRFGGRRTRGGPRRP